MVSQKSVHQLEAEWKESCRKSHEAWKAWQIAKSELSEIVEKVRSGSRLIKILVYEGWYDSDRYEYYLDGEEIGPSDDWYLIDWIETDSDEEGRECWIATVTDS